MEMSVFRVNKNANYTVLSNYHFREKGMSLKAKGLLSLMLSLPENWDYSAAGLVTLSKDGKDSVNAALKELEKFGYLRRSQAVDENGKFRGYNYEIFEQPIQQPKEAIPKTDKPFAENPSTGKPTTENPQELSTNESSTKISNTEISNTEEEEERKKETPSSYDAIVNDRIKNDEVKTALFEFIKMRKFIKKPLTNYALTELINKLEGMTADPSEQVEILKKSILNNYPDIFPLKEEKKETKTADVRPLFDTNEETDADDVFKCFKGNVLLTENQIADLLERLDLAGFDYYIDKLSKYISERGNVNGHYRTILKWSTEDRAVAR